MTKRNAPAQTAGDRIACPPADRRSDRGASDSPRKRDQSLKAIFLWPLILGVLSLIGLVGALLVEGPWDWVFAALIATCVVAIIWARARVRRSPRP